MARPRSKCPAPLNRRRVFCFWNPRTVSARFCPGRVSGLFYFLPPMKTGLSIEWRPVAGLIPYARNSRTHSDAQVAQIAASIREFGFTNPVLVDGENGIIAGHGRVLAARKLDMPEVPCIELGHLSPAQRRAYIIADNKMALNAGWDDELLAIELGELQDDGFDLGLTGFSAGEIDALLGLGEPEKPGAGGGIDYQEKFAVLVDCDGEAHQREIFERLTDMGLSCKVLVN